MAAELKRNKKIVRTLVLILIGAMAVPLSGIALLEFFIFKPHCDRLTALHEEEMTIKVRQVHNQSRRYVEDFITEYLENQRINMERIIRAEWFIKLTRSQKKDYLTKYLDATPSLKQIILMTDLGEEILSMQSLSDEESSLAHEVIMSVDISENVPREFFYGEVFGIPEEEELMLMMGHPMPNVEGKPAGLMLVLVDLTPLEAFISDFKVGDTGYAFVVDRQGKAILHPDYDVALSRSDYSYLPIVQEYQRDITAGLHQYSDEKGVEWIGTAESMESPGWGIITSEKRDTAFFVLDKMYTLNEQIFFKMRLLLAVMISISFFIVMVAMNHYRKNIRAPLLRLEAGFKELSEGDLETRVRPDTLDETGRIIETFNEAVKKLKSQIKG